MVARGSSWWRKSKAREYYSQHPILKYSDIEQYALDHFLLAEDRAAFLNEVLEHDIVTSNQIPKLRSFSKSFDIR